MAFETISSLATPMGLGGIGVVRLSGDRSLEIINALANKPIKTPRYVYYTPIKDPFSGEKIDDVCVLYFQAPHSYTGEDVVEIQGHGSPYSLNKIIEMTLRLGARMADPGEYTKRAFINGKLTLSQAEAVIDLIHAESESAHRVSMTQLKGALMTKITEIRAVLMEILEQVEGSIDFPDEVPALDRPKTIDQLVEQAEMLSKMSQYGDYGEKIKSGLSLVIVGVPNAGKSSLLNAFLGKDRAIVTPEKGTTRDYLEVTITLGGVGCTLIDTAGIRDADDYIEHLGIQKITELLEKADVVLWLVDGSVPLTKEDRHVASLIQDCKTVVLVKTKADLPNGEWRKQISEYPYPSLSVHTKDSSGIAPLKEYLYEHVIPKIEPAALEWTANVRQAASIKAAQSAIIRFIEGLQTDLEDDVIAIDLKAAILKLGEVSGETLTEEVLDGIFSRFCVGK